MKEFFIRKLDELGRIVLPYETRQALNWNNNTEIAVCRDGNNLILAQYNRSCILCGSIENTKLFHNNSICQTCIEEIKHEDS